MNHATLANELLESLRRNIAVSFRPDDYLCGSIITSTRNGRTITQHLLTPFVEASSINNDNVLAGIVARQRDTLLTEKAPSL